MIFRTDSRLVHSQWETALLCDDVSHWLGASPDNHSGGNKPPNIRIRKGCRLSDPIEYFNGCGTNCFEIKITTKCSLTTDLAPILWWRQDMHARSVLLAFYTGNPTITGWIPSQRASNVDLWCLLCCSLDQAAEQSICQWYETPCCPACRTSLIATRFWVVVICPIIKCLTVLEFSFILFDLCLFITIFNFILNYVPIVTFWIFTYHKIWILLIIFCFIWNYWIIYFSTCLEVLWSVVS